jgi:hypothetical protein
VRRPLLYHLLCITLFTAATAFGQSDWPHTGKYGQGTRHIHIVNEMDRDVWVMFQSIPSVELPHDEVFLAAHTDTVYEMPNTWVSGMFYPTFDKEHIQAPSATLVEFTLNDNGVDTYDISLVNAFNIPIMVYPREGMYKCWHREDSYDGGVAGCTENLIEKAPAELIYRDQFGNEVALGGCQAAIRGLVDGASRSWFCCESDHNLPQTCPANKYAQAFKSACPNAYSYAYDDQRSTYHCHVDSVNHIGPDFEVFFGYNAPSRIEWPAVQPAQLRTSLRMTHDGQLQYSAAAVSAKDLRLDVFTCGGKLVRQHRLSRTSGSLALTGLPQGAYLATLAAGRILKTERIVIAR